MAYPTRYYRLYNFLLDQLRGLTFNNGKLDAELSAIQVTLDQLNTRVRGITNADGTLKNVAAATALSLAGAQRFVATAAQTQFDTSIAWDSTFSASSVVVFAQGSRIDSNSVTVANNAGNLRVTIPARSLNDVVIVNAYQPGTVSAAAADVTIADAGSYYASDNVEDALQEVQNNATYGVRTLIAALPGGSIAGLASYLLKDGSVAMTGDLNMGGGSGGGYVSANGHKVKGLKGGSQAGDAVEWTQFTAFTTVWNNLATYFLKLDGSSTMAGSLNMGNQYITNLKNADITVDTDAANVATVRALITSNGGLPTGTVIDYAGSVPPTGWLLCDGSEVAQATYTALYTVVGATYGAASAGNFKLPDARGRASIGVGTGSGLTARALGATGGEETHTLITAELPAHTHPNTLGVGHSTSGGSSGVSEAAPTSSTPDTGSTGSGTAHNNMQPYIAFTKIIKY